jgi:phenylacetate-coenzyme A ligase PaaK-like adenylate-forming protein
MPLRDYAEGLYWLHDFFDRSRMVRRSRAELQARQQAGFRRLAQYAIRYSPYYATLAHQRGLDPSTCTVADFSVLTKQDVIEHFDRIVTDRRITREAVEAFVRHQPNPTRLFRDRFYVVHTSGSSGRVAYFVYSAREWIRGSSHLIRCLGPLRVRKRTAYVGVVSGRYTGVSLAMTASRLINRAFFRPLALDVNSPTAQIVEGLNSFQPQVLITYGVPLYVLAIEQTLGRLAIHPQRIISSGEPLLSESRSYIEAAFGVPVTNVYASSEHLLMGIGDPRHSDMYLLEDDLIFECHEDHTCVTNLFNRTLPLIRYRMDDVLVPSERQTSTHPFQTVKNIVGRAERPVVLKNRDGQEDFIHPAVFTEMFVKDMLAFQIKMIDNTSFLFRAQLRPGITDRQRSRAREGIGQNLQRILASKNMESSVSFRIEEVDSFSVDKQSGKFRLIETDRTYQSLDQLLLEPVVA